MWRLICFLTGFAMTGSLIWGIIDTWKVASLSVGIDAIGYMGIFYFVIFGFLPIGLFMIYISIKGE